MITLVFSFIFVSTSVLRLAESGEPAHINLRSTYKILTEPEVLAWQKSLSEEYKDNVTGNRIVNHNYRLDTINGNSVVIDNVTGLMWHQSGSKVGTTWQDAQKWIDSLNSEGYAGFTDWRLPTLEEAASLLQSEASDYGLYIDSLFDKKQKYIWTGDIYADPDRWYVDFDEGKVIWSSKWIYGFNRNLRINFARPVRTSK
ncbi:MAG: hypothetical protein SCALA701_30050 [Candidatus Scalindua sp.]|nr:MAG: hypothetical protein SCALA701_30050 [Candidatus Scalindua sp.]